MARGAGGGDYFKTFLSKGSDYLREAINQGTAITRGNMVVLDTLNNNKIKNQRGRKNHVQLKLLHLKTDSKKVSAPST